MARRDPQLSLSLPAQRQWGGRRTGAGRKRVGKPGIKPALAHVSRERFRRPLPAHVTLFTGEPELVHGVEQDGQRIPDELPTLAERLLAATGPLEPGERDWPTAAAVTAAVLGGAHIVRVHAVEKMIHVVRVADAIRLAADT